MKLAKVSGLILALLFCLAACGGGGGGGNPGPGPTQRLTLNGRVLNQAGAPVAGAQVLLSLNSTQTDASGNFSYANLPPGSYVLSVQDSQGNYDSRSITLDADSVQFQFSLPSEGSSFRVIETAPLLNSDGAPLGGSISLMFSAALDVASVDVEDFSFTPDIGEFSVQASGSQLTISPRLQLPTGQNVLLEMPGAISASDGSSLSRPLRLRFQTNTTDNAAPVLVGSRPLPGATAHPPNLSLNLEFNEELAEDLSGLVISVQPEHAVSTRVSGRNLIISPLDGWDVLTDYTVELSGVRDLAGNVDNQVHVIGFRTREQPLNSHNIEADWNLSTNSIVFASDLDGDYDIYSIRPDGSELTQLLDRPGAQGNPTLNGDGRLLAWQERGSGGLQQIMLLTLDDASAEPVELTSASYQNTDPYFSRSFNNNLVFVSTRQSVTGLWNVSVDNRLETELDQAFGSGQYEPAFHPLIDGQLLFDSGRSGNSDIWRKTISVISGESININLTQQLLSEDHSPAWSPDAASFVFISDFDGHDNLWNGDLTGDFHTQLTFLDTDLSNPIIDPVGGNNRCLVTMENGTGGSDLVLIDLSSGEILQHLTGE